MKTQFLFLAFIVFSCIVKAQGVSNDFVVFQGHLFLSGGWKVETEKDQDHRSASFVSVDAMIDKGIIPIDWGIVARLRSSLAAKEGMCSGGLR